MLWAYILGFGFSISVGLLIGFVTDTMRGEETDRGWKKRMEGSVEQVLYTSSLVIGQAVLIAAWLGIKTAAQWQGWTQRKDFSDNYLSPYFVGNALSVVVAITGANMIKWSLAGHYFLWLAPATVGLAILCLFFWAEYQARRHPKTNETNSQVANPPVPELG